MPNITIGLVSGNTVEKKRELVAKITDAIVEVLKVPREIVLITITEEGKENIAKGGVLLSDK